MARLERGSPIGSRWFVERAPSSEAVGALVWLKDETGVVRAALIGAIDGPAASRRDPAADAAAHAGRTLEVSREWLVANGMAMEVLASDDRTAAYSYYVKLRAASQAGAVGARLAEDLSVLVDDLSALHATGVVHGGIEPWMLLARNDAPHLVLAGFATARAANRVRVTPSDELARLAAIVTDLARDAIDDAAMVGAFPSFDATRDGRAWSESLRAWAAQIGGPYRHGADAKTNAPLFPSAAYHEAPIELPTKRSRSDDPGLLSEMRPSDWRLFIRLGMFGVIAIGGFVSFLVRSGSRSAPPATSAYEDRDERHTPTPATRDEERRNSGTCHGEPIAPVATSTLPGVGAVESIAAHCGGGALRVMVHRGDSLWLVTRGSTVGLPWDEWGSENIVTDSARVLSRSAPSDDGTTFVGWISRDRGTVGVAQFGLPVVVHAASVQGLDESGALFALGATQRFAYLATTLGRPAQRTVILRVDLTADRENSRADVFTMANSIALSVWPRSDRPHVLVRDVSTVRDVTLDLAQLDAIDPAPRARALPEGAMHSEAETQPASPLLSAAPDAIAADFGNGTFGPVRFAIARGASADAGHYGEAHVLSVENHALTESGLVTVDAEPLSFVARIGGSDLFVRGREGDVRRVAFTNEMVPTSGRRLVLPPRAPQPDAIDATACAETAWLVFADARSSDPRIAALPAACTTPE